LDVTYIVPTNSIFTVDTTQFSCVPFDSVPITVSFNSANVGTENGWLLMSSNDPDTPVDSVWVEATTIPEPLVGLTPGNIETKVGIDDSVEVFLNVENTGGSNLVWSAGTSYDPVVTLAPMGPVEAPLPEHLDFDPMALPSLSPVVSPDGFGDLLLHLNDLTGITGSTSHLGVAYAEGHFWITASEAGSPPNWLHKIDESGNLVQSFSQPTTTWGWRDLAYDGTYLYGSVSSVIEQIDPANGQPTGLQIPGPANPNRALGYDPATDHFWVVNFANPLFEIDRSGNIINQFTNPVSSYGAAWDVYTDGGPWLWLNAGTGTGETHHMDQVDPMTGQLTGVSIIGIANMIAGGLDATSEMDLYPGLAVMLAIGQSTSLTVWELAEAGVPWLSLNPSSGVISAGDNTDISVKVYGDTVNADTAYVVMRTNAPTTPAVNVQVARDVTVVGLENLLGIPTTYAVSQNYPNPFNPTTSIRYQLPSHSQVKLSIYNVLGQRVRTLLDKEVEAGYHMVEWDGLNDAGNQIASGVYLYRFEAGDYRRTIKMIMMK